MGAYLGDQTDAWVWLMFMPGRQVPNQGWVQSTVAWRGAGLTRRGCFAGGGAGGATRLAVVTLGQEAEVLRTIRAPSRSPEDAVLLGSGLTPSTLGFTSVCWASVRGLALTKELAGSIRASGTLA